MVSTHTHATLLSLRLAAYFLSHQCAQECTFFAGKHFTERCPWYCFWGRSGSSGGELLMQVWEHTTTKKPEERGQRAGSVYKVSWGIGWGRGSFHCGEWAPWLVLKITRKIRAEASSKQRTQHGLIYYFGYYVKTLWQQVAENLASNSLNVRRFIISQCRLSIERQGSRQGTAGLWPHFTVALPSFAGFASSAVPDITGRHARDWGKSRDFPCLVAREHLPSVP